MKKISFFVVAVITMLGLSGTVYPAFAATDMVGSMIGDVSGYVTDSAGNQVSPEAAVSADVQVSFDDSGNVNASIAGTASCTGGLGVHIDYSADYNAATGELTGAYTTPGNSTPQAIQFTPDGNLEWQAHIVDSVVDNGETRPYAIDIALVLPDTAIYAGNQFPSGTRLTGSLNTSINLQAPISLPQYGIDQTIDTTLTIDGQWVASFVAQADGSTVLTGFASGTFSSPEITITASLTGMTYPVSFTLDGDFGGSLFSDDLENLKFAGTYAQSGDANVNYSGAMEISVPINPDGSITTMPFTFSGTPAVNISVIGSSISVPITISGNLPFVMN